jgi:hypothetical protein
MSQLFFGQVTNQSSSSISDFSFRISEYVSINDAATTVNENISKENTIYAFICRGKKNNYRSGGLHRT